MLSPGQVSPARGRGASRGGEGLFVGHDDRDAQVPARWPRQCEATSQSEGTFVGFAALLAVANPLNFLLLCLPPQARVLSDENFSYTVTVRVLRQASWFDDLDLRIVYPTSSQVSPGDKANAWEVRLLSQFMNEQMTAVAEHTPPSQVCKSQQDFEKLQSELLKQVCASL